VPPLPAGAGSSPELALLHAASSKVAVVAAIR
jgi:hypothetical protein